MKTMDVTVSRTIQGAADEVFDVWLDPKSPGGLWFGVERAILNPVVDGLFYHGRIYSRIIASTDLPDDEMGRGHKDGWTWYLNALAERFDKVAAR